MHAPCKPSAYSTWLETWCFLPLLCVLCVWASSTPGTHIWAVHHIQSRYLPCVRLERGLKQWLQCTAFKTIPFSFRARNESRTSRRSTAMAPPEVSMRTANSSSKKYHAASFTICLSVEEVEPFPTTTCDRDSHLTIGHESDQMRWLNSGPLIACAHCNCNKSRFMDLPSSFLTLATATWCWGIDHTSETILPLKPTGSSSDRNYAKVHFCAVIHPAPMSDNQHNALTEALSGD